MWVVVAGTMVAPVTESFTGTSTFDPWKTSPFVGSRITTWAVLLGRT